MLVAAILVVALAWHMLIFTLGYLIAGRALAMEVADLTIGLGPRITSFVLGNTHYDIRLVPLGASVRLADESPTLRLAVFSCAGPLLNMFAAGVLLTLIYMYSYQDRSHSTANAVVFAGEQSPAHNAGIYSGDSILQIADVSNPDWETVEMETSWSGPVKVLTGRGGRRLTMTVSPQLDPCNDEPAIGWDVWGEIYVARVLRGRPAEAAGLLPGDTIVRIDGQQINAVLQLQNLVQNSRGKPLEMVVAQNGKERPIRVSAVEVHAHRVRLWKIGAIIERRSEVTSRRLPLKQAVLESARDSAHNVGMFMHWVELLLVRRASLRVVSGPLTVFSKALHAARRGRFELGAYIASLMLFLGLYNLLPIPILPGGGALMAAIESVFGKIRLEWKERFYQMGFVFLVLLAVMVIYNDLYRVLPSLPRKGDPTPICFAVQYES